jgi:hypothetical protein
MTIPDSRSADEGARPAICPFCQRQGRRHARNNRHRDDVLAVSRVRQDVDDPQLRRRSRTLANAGSFP